MGEQTATGSMTKQQVNLLNTLRKLWTDHVMWTRSFILSTALGLGDLPFVTNELLRNPGNFANVLRPLYGEQKAEAFEALLTDHLKIAAQLVNDLKNGDIEAAEEQHEKWYANADDIAKALPLINPHWNMAEWQRLLYDHLNMTEYEAAQILAKDFEDSITQYNRIEDEALEMADTMAYGIMKQFPNM